MHISWRRFWKIMNASSRKLYHVTLVVRMKTNCGNTISHLTHLVIVLSHWSLKRSKKTLTCVKNVTPFFSHKMTCKWNHHGHFFVTSYQVMSHRRHVITKRLKAIVKYCCNKLVMFYVTCISSQNETRRSQGYLDSIHFPRRLIGILFVTFW